MVSEVRAFNRFYTNIIGLLNQHLHNSQYSLAEARLLFEIYHQPHIQASRLTELMQIDKSYLSRLLQKLGKQQLISKKKAPEDARATLLTLTPKGKRLFLQLNQSSDKQIEDLLTPLPRQQQQQLVHHMQEIRHILQSTQSLQHE